MSVHKTPSIASALSHSMTTAVAKAAAGTAFTLTPSVSLSAVLILNEYANETYLGQGFKDDSKVLVSQCLKGRLEGFPVKQADFSFSAGADSESVYSRISGKVRGSVNILVAGVSGSSEYISSKLNEETGMSSVITYTYQKHRLKLTDPLLTNVGLGAVSSSETKFRDICGTSVVDEATMGGRLHIVARLVYIGKSEYKYQKTKIKGEVLGVTVSKKTKVSESEEISKLFVLNVSAHQLGGDLAKLNTLLSSSPAYCSLTAPDKCSDLYAALIRYAKNDFPSSFQNDSSLAVLSMSTTDYSDMGMTTVFPKFSSKASQTVFKNKALATYRGQLTDLLAKKEKAEAQLLSGVYTSGTDSSLRTDISAADGNINILKQKISTCELSTDESMCEF